MLRVFGPVSAVAQRCRQSCAANCQPHRRCPRALSLIAEGVLDQGSVSDLAAQLGVSDRHLRRLFTQHLGVSAVSDRPDPADSLCQKAIR